MSDARSRTRSHLSRLSLAVTGLVACVGTSNAGDPAPVKPPTPTQPPGYGVVDPMPPPAFICGDTKPDIWKQGLNVTASPDGAEVTLNVYIAAYRVKNLTLDPSFVVEGASIKTQEVRSNEMVLRLVPNGKELKLQITMVCGDQKSALRYKIPLPITRNTTLYPEP